MKERETEEKIENEIKQQETNNKKEIWFLFESSIGDMKLRHSRYQEPKPVFSVGIKL